MGTGMVAPRLAWQGVKRDRGGGAAGGGEWESGQVSPISLAQATHTPSLPDVPGVPGPAAPRDGDAG